MFTFHAYNITPLEAPILEYVKAGNISGVQKLLTGVLQFKPRYAMILLGSNFEDLRYDDSLHKATSNGIDITLQLNRPRHILLTAHLKNLPLHGHVT